MKIIYIFLIAIVSHYSFAQNLKFNLLGEASYTLIKNNKSADELFTGIKNYISEAYPKDSPCIILIDTLNYRVKISESMPDALSRGNYLSRRPVLTSNYDMEISVTESKIDFKFKHLKFQSENLDYYLTLQDLFDELSDPLSYDNEKQLFTDNFIGLINTYDYYIDNKIIKIQYGYHLDQPDYFKQSIEFDDEGVSKVIIIDFKGLTAERISERISSFINKYYFRPNVEYGNNNQKF